MNESDELSILNDARFQQRLARRSRLRWGLSGLLVVTYVVYSLAGIYASDLLGMTFMNSSISWGIVIGYAIMVLAIVLSLVYVRVIGKLYPSQTGDRPGDR